MVANNVIYIHLRANPKPRKDHIIIIIYTYILCRTRFDFFYRLNTYFTCARTRNTYIYIHTHSLHLCIGTRKLLYHMVCTFCRTVAMRENPSSNNNNNNIRDDYNTSRSSWYVIIDIRLVVVKTAAAGCLPPIYYYNIVNTKYGNIYVLSIIYYIRWSRDTKM